MTLIQKQLQVENEKCKSLDPRVLLITTVSLGTFTLKTDPFQLLCSGKEISRLLRGSGAQSVDPATMKGLAIDVVAAWPYTSAILGLQ